MKSTIVPAQITTVEDKIAGSLSLSQLILLAAPMFFDGVVYIIFPPGLKFVLYKVVLSIIVALLFASMAIRVKGKILLLWVMVIAKYNLRPRYYVFNKNDTHLRRNGREYLQFEEAPESVEESIASDQKRIEIALHELAQMDRMLTDRRASLAIKPAKKGGLHVTLTEVE